MGFVLFFTLVPTMNLFSQRFITSEDRKREMSDISSGSRVVEPQVKSKFKKKKVKKETIVTFSAQHSKQK